MVTVVESLKSMFDPFICFSAPENKYTLFPRGLNGESLGEENQPSAAGY